MRNIFLGVTGLSVCIAMAWGAESQPRTEPELKAACHGTAVEFADSPVAAAKLAAKQKKLVLVLHVSGHFEDPNFT